MIAGIVAFAAIATSVAFGYPCGETVVCNGCSGNVMNSGLNSGVLTEGILGSGAVSSSQFGSDIAATPTAISSIFFPTACTVTAPASQPFGGIVGSGSEVISTEALIPEYSTLVAPSASSSASGESLSSGVTSVFLPSFGHSPVVSSGIVSSGHCGSASSPVVASFGYPSVQSEVSSEVYETPAVSVVASPVSSHLFGSSQILSSGCGSSVFGSSGISSGVVSAPVSASIVAAPVVEAANVVAPMASAEYVSSGVSSESFLNEDCGC